MTRSVRVLLVILAMLTVIAGGASATPQTGIRPESLKSTVR